MSKLIKLWQKIKNNPKQVRFEELDKILIKAGFTRRQSRGGSSHYVYRRKNTVPITIPYRQPHILETYVEQVVKALEGEFDDEQ